ncbi:MAG TPA: aminoglycoside phosphotransferase family protein [Candidatus Binatus sp.]|nr:aminoglycoside phosphotransferase family protein [Candidatus Binatus sp.]
MRVTEIDISSSLVRRLLTAQFPAWADLPLTRVRSGGTDNAIYRLGDDMCVRLPRIEWTTAQLDKEHEWLPRLAPHLPLAVPVPIAKGKRAENYPWHWSICRWLPGENAFVEHFADLRDAAIGLAQFVAAMQRIDTAGGPRPGAHNFGRGVPLAIRDADTRAAIAKLDAILDTDAVTAAWDDDSNAPVLGGPPVWIHGDFHGGNLLVDHGRLSAVIDFGGLGVGDPACDFAAAWTIFSGESRDAFRAALSIDDASWARSRAWALSTGLIALPYYLDTNPMIVAMARRQIAEVLADRQRTC